MSSLPLEYTAKSAPGSSSLPGMADELRELYRFRELLISMVQRELRIRYKNSALGFLWSFVNPLATTAVMTLVFNRLLQNGVENYSAYVLAAYLPFMFFQSSVLDSAQSVLASLPLVKKIYFPREILPLASVIANFIHLLLGFAVFFMLLLVVYILHPAVVPFQATTVLLPVLFLISFMLSVGLSLIVSALNTFYEDVKYVMSVFLYLLFFMCPVMYFEEQIANTGMNVRSHGLWFKIYNLNPVAVLCDAYRKILLAPQPIKTPNGIAQPLPIMWNYVAYSFVASAIVMVLGYHVFNRMKWRFVERP